MRTMCSVCKKVWISPGETEGDAISHSMCIVCTIESYGWGPVKKMKMEDINSQFNKENFLLEEYLIQN